MPPVVIDTDPGVDDALALLQAWGTPSLTVEAITTVAGNVPVTAGTLNVFRLLALREPRPAPVVGQGAAAPLTRTLVTATRYHGEDGETRRVAGAPNVRIARRVDTARFMPTFLAALCRASS